MKYFVGLLILFAVQHIKAQPGIPFPTEEPVAVQDSVFQIVNDVPVFQGCSEVSSDERQQCSISGVMKFLAKNTIYPEQAKEEGLEGTVYVRMLVLKDGSVSDVRVLRGVNPILDQEAIRVVSMLKYDQPAMMNGKPVIFEQNIPIKFKLN
ncbi:MAG: hypothetical protein RL226_2302 [Bacteroidota bacterium]